MDKFIAGSIVSNKTGASLKLTTMYNMFYNQTDHVNQLPLNQWGILFTSSLNHIHPGWWQHQARKGLYPFALKGLYGTWSPAQWFDVYYTDAFVFFSP
jgi:hypothetical protein